MAQEDVQLPAFVHRGVQLMLAAGDGEDVLRALLDRVVQGVVGGGVAGVECDHHVHPLAVQHVLRDVRVHEAQSAVAVFFGDGVAVRDHVRFQVVADDGYVHAPFDGEIVIEDEGQITFAAAEVQDRDRLPVAVREGLVDQLDEAVDLPVLVVTGLDDPVVRREDAEIHQRRDRLALGEQVALLAVVSLRRRGTRHGGGADLLVQAVLPQAVLRGGRLRHDQHLPVAPVQLVCAQPQQRLALQILMEGLRAAPALELEYAPAPDKQGAHAELLVRAPVGRLAEHRLGERVQRRGELACEIPVFHLIQTASSNAARQPSARSCCKSCSRRQARRKRPLSRSAPRPPSRPPAWPPPRPCAPPC